MQENGNLSETSLINKCTIKNILLHMAGWTPHHCSFLTALEGAPESHLPTPSKDTRIQDCSEAEVEEGCGEGWRAILGGPVG